MVNKVLVEILVRLEIQDSLETSVHLGQRVNQVRLDHEVVLDQLGLPAIQDKLDDKDRLAVLACLDKLELLESMEHRVCRDLLATLDHQEALEVLAHKVPQVPQER